MKLDPSSDLPPHRQIVDQIWTDVVEARRQPGERLPTVRQLAIELSVHPDTVQRAYQELELLGVVVRRAGEGDFVGLKPADREELERRSQLDRLSGDTVRQARELGFGVNELIDAIAEWRNANHNDPE